MKLFTNKIKLEKEIKNINNISFVPTMGALHRGHESIIKKSTRESKKTIVSIYINPKQFNSKSDFDNYPKTFKKDFKILKKFKVKYCFKPNYKDLFNFKTKNKIFLDKFSKRLCGRFRKGHFRGVLDVVNRFIEIIKPKKIYLGEKDYQQLILIQKHIKRYKIKTKIIPCKTIRDKNYIAYSSRLKKLNKYEKLKLIKIIKVLKNYKRNLSMQKFTHNFNKIKKQILSVGIKKIDYIEIIDLKTLRKPKKNKKKFKLFFAFYIGKVRFIDNF